VEPVAKFKKLRYTTTCIYGIHKLSINAGESITTETRQGSVLKNVAHTSEILDMFFAK
jgi:hypothetical protein